MMTGGRTTTQAVQTGKTEPWGPTVPHRERALTGAQQLYEGPGQQYYPYETYAPVSPETRGAWGAQTARAVTGSPLMPAARGQQMATISGAYTDPRTNPFLGNVAEATGATIRPQVESMFAGAGRGGSPLQAEAFGRGVGRAMAPYTFGAYQQERGLQEQASRFAPQLAAADYQDIGKLAEVGAQKEQREGMDPLQDAINRWNWQQQQPQQQLQTYLGNIGAAGGAGGTTTTSRPVYGGGGLFGK